MLNELNKYFDRSIEKEVYDKKGMYGADVISCLTKAENNNEKYSLYILQIHRKRNFSQHYKN